MLLFFTSSVQGGRRFDLIDRFYRFEKTIQRHLFAPEISQKHSESKFSNFLEIKVFSVLTSVECLIALLLYLCTDKGAKLCYIDLDSEHIFV